MNNSSLLYVLISISCSTSLLTMQSDCLKEELISLYDVYQEKEVMLSGNNPQASCFYLCYSNHNYLFRNYYLKEFKKPSTELRDVVCKLYADVQQEMKTVNQSEIQDFQQILLAIEHLLKTIILAQQ